MLRSLVVISSRTCQNQITKSSPSPSPPSYSTTLFNKPTATSSAPHTKVFSSDPVKIGKISVGNTADSPSMKSLTSLPSSKVPALPCWTRSKSLSFQISSIVPSSKRSTPLLTILFQNPALPNFRSRGTPCLTAVPTSLPKNLSFGSEPAKFVSNSSLRAAATPFPASPPTLFFPPSMTSPWSSPTPPSLFSVLTTKPSTPSPTNSSTTSSNIAL
mmetsp:Transcript_573/g.1021  ORF Transcript_573/g.1021 Transcript_573/m.1021 type:complete len:215 (-) Transcript_573:923-1567(-)